VNDGPILWQASAARGRHVQTYNNALQFGFGRRIVFHHERIVSRHDVLGRFGQPVEQFEAFQHLPHVECDRKRASLLEIRV